VYCRARGHIHYAMCVALDWLHRDTGQWFMNYKVGSHFAGASIHKVRNSQKAFIPWYMTQLISIRRSDNDKTGYQTNKRNADVIIKLK
jgi:hypothetical protein